MEYEIIEDCSPYYIRFKHIGINDVATKCLNYIQGLTFEKPFTHYRYPEDQSREILSSIPFSKETKLNPNRVSLFITKPGFYYRAHKDGLDIRFGINYTIKVLDKNCVTNWYSDEDLKHYEIDNLVSKTSRECINFDRTRHTPLKSLTALEGECILFNTNIFHDFDNSNSLNERIILTLRPTSLDKSDFFDIRKIIFNCLCSTMDSTGTS